MRLTILCLCLILQSILAKSVTKSLTESLGQEVIEIGAPLKDLPGELEEEPSAERDDDDATSTTVQAATKKEVKKATTNDSRRKMKDVDKIDSVNRRQEDDEDRVEKELADLYKDSNDYNRDSDEVSSTVMTERTEKPALRGRGRDSFKFQPDLNNPKEVERFRTSVDEISCDKSVTKKLDGTTTTPKGAASHFLSMALLLLCGFSIICV